VRGVNVTGLGIQFRPGSTVLHAGIHGR